MYNKSSLCALGQERVSLILEQAKSNVVQSVNHNTVIANWLIGREIVLEIQDGEKLAEYGKQVLKNLSKQLNTRYGSGWVKWIFI